MTFSSDVSVVTTTKVTVSVVVSISILYFVVSVSPRLAANSLADSSGSSMRGTSI